MVDTVRTRAVILTTLFQDGQVQGISAQDMRDFVVSSAITTPTIVAAAGSNQGSATVLAEQFNIVTSGTGGVVATTGYTKVWNALAVPINIYPVSGANFEAYATNAPIVLGAGASVEISMTTSTQGYVR